MRLIWFDLGWCKGHSCLKPWNDTKNSASTASPSSAFTVSTTGSASAPATWHKQISHLTHLIISHLINIFQLLENGTEDQHHHHPQQDHHAAHENVASDGRWGLHSIEHIITNKLVRAECVRQRSALRWPLLVRAECMCQRSALRWPLF